MHTQFWSENLKRPLESPRGRCEDNIRTALTAIGWKGVERVHLFQDRDQWWGPVNMVMNLRVP